MQLTRCFRRLDASTLRRTLTLHYETTVTRSAQLKFLAAANIGAYLVINLLMFVLGPVTRGLSQLGMTAIVVPPMVLAMVFLVMPVARRLAQGSIQTERSRAQA